MKTKLFVFLLAASIIFVTPAAHAQAGAQVEWRPGLFGFKAPFKFYIGSNGAGMSFDLPSIGTPIGDFNLNFNASYHPSGRGSQAPVQYGAIIVYIDGQKQSASPIQSPGNYTFVVQKGLKLVRFDRSGADLIVSLQRDYAQQQADKYHSQLNSANSTIARQQEQLARKQAQLSGYKEKVDILRQQRSEAYAAAQDATRQAKQRGDKVQSLKQEVEEKDKVIATLQQRISDLEADTARLQEDLRRQSAQPSERRVAFHRSPSPSHSSPTQSETEAVRTARRNTSGRSSQSSRIDSGDTYRVTEHLSDN